MRVFLIRHGQSTENATDLQQLLTIEQFRHYLEDAKGSVLTSLGVEQAHAVGRALRSVQPTHLYSSPFQRAQQTAEIISEELDLPITIVPDLHEVTALAPLVFRRTRPRSLKTLYIRGYLHQLLPRKIDQGETWWVARRRIVRVWNELSSAWDASHRVVMVSHRAFIWLTLRHLERATPWHVVQRNLNNAGISEVVLPVSPLAGLT